MSFNTKCMTAEKFKSEYLTQSGEWNEELKTRKDEICFVIAEATDQDRAMFVKGLQSKANASVAYVGEGNENLEAIF